jgi:hypothetical protein
VTVQRVLRDTQSQPEVTFYVGTTSTAADGAVTVDILRGDGTIFATDAATSHIGSAGQYRYTLAPQANLELFTLQWEGTFGGVVQRITSQVEVVGGYVVSLADLAAESGMGSKTPAELAEARQWFEDRAESYCGVAFVPRYAREVLDGPGSARLDLRHPRPRSIISAKFDGVVQTTTTWDLYEAGYIVNYGGSFPWGFRNVELIYEHGYDQAPSDIRDAALTAIRSNVLGGGSAGGGIPAGVTQLATDAGVMTFGRRTFPFGIPEVDAVLGDRRVPMLA